MAVLNFLTCKDTPAPMVPGTSAPQSWASTRWRPACCPWSTCPARRGGTRRRRCRRGGSASPQPVGWTEAGGKCGGPIPRKGAFLMVGLLGKIWRSRLQLMGRLNSVSLNRVAVHILLFIPTLSFNGIRSLPFSGKRSQSSCFNGIGSQN